MKIGQSIWHCKFLGLNENGAKEYSAPTEYKLNLNYLSINPKSGYISTIQYGAKISNMWSMVAKKTEFDGVFKEGDVLYIEGNEPNVLKPNGENANAIVKAVLPRLISITVDLEKIQP